MSAVSLKCCTFTHKCGKHNSIVLNFRTLHSFLWCNAGPRYSECSKSSGRVCQHGWCCYDDLWKNMGNRWGTTKCFHVSAFLCSLSVRYFLAKRRSNAHISWFCTTPAIVIIRYFFLQKWGTYSCGRSFWPSLSCYIWPIYWLGFVFLFSFCFIFFI